ncbi:hypothetical protein KSP39_PZI016143 [Platanthera zijinensis]|uniref:Pentatricopeptide repeat-containing protein n=1 Tax=Platanthera zijinensis TaxID=2320716 RepID=A0AAP0G0E5_9ASPA
MRKEERRSSTWNGGGAWEVLGRLTMKQASCALTTSKRPACSKTSASTTDMTTTPDFSSKNNRKRTTEDKALGVHHLIFESPNIRTSEISCSRHQAAARNPSLSAMPDIVAHTATIEAYANVGEHSKEAICTFNRMLASDVSHNAYTYTILVKGFARDSKIPEAQKYLL